MEFTHYWGPHFHWFWFLPVFFMILMFVVACRAARRTGYRRWGSARRTFWLPFGCWNPGVDLMDRWPDGTPEQILDRRYARGEITKEQYEEMKRDIRSSPS